MFDANGNLATLTDPCVDPSGPSTTASFQYDALGRGRSKAVNGTTTDFLVHRVKSCHRAVVSLPVCFVAFSYARVGRGFPMVSVK
jgi:hypothetical protein